MKLDQSFEVAAPIDVVWRALNDLERVAPCLPGATITGHDEDGTYRGEFKVKLGPTTAEYRGTIKVTEADEAAHRATLTAKGSDKRGQGGASATIVQTLVAIESGTRVDSSTDFSITGRLARFGRGGMIEDVSNRLMRDFAACLRSRIVAGEPPPSGEEITKGEEPPEAAAG
jgi:carbon monoxide dehydrogenase subunit G